MHAIVFTIYADFSVTHAATHQKTMVFPTIEPFGLSVSMLPADMQSKLLAFTGMDSSKGAGYIGRSAALLQEAQVAWSRFYATNQHLVTIGQEHMTKAFEATKDLRGALEKAYEDLSKETEESDAVKEGMKKLGELKKEFEDNKQLSGFVSQVDSVDKLQALAQSSQATKIMDRLKSLAEAVGKSDQVKDLMDAATPELDKLQQKFTSEGTLMLEAAPDQLEQKKNDLFAMSGTSVEKTLMELTSSDDAKALLKKGEELLGDFGLSKDDLDANKLLSQATSYIPQVTEQATKMLADQGLDTVMAASQLIDQHKGVTDVIMQQMQKHGGSADGSLSAEQLLASAASYVDQVECTILTLYPCTILTLYPCTILTLGGRDEDHRGDWEP
jgi:hypothetical protein